MAFQEKTNQLMNQIGQTLTFTAAHQAKQKATESLKEQQATKFDIKNIKQYLTPEAFAERFKEIEENRQQIKLTKPNGGKF